MNAPDSLPTDAKALRALLLAERARHAEELAAARDAKDHAQGEIARLMTIIKELQRHRFGRRSASSAPAVRSRAISAIPSAPISPVGIGRGRHVHEADERPLLAPPAMASTCPRSLYAGRRTAAAVRRHPEATSTGERTGELGQPKQIEARNVGRQHDQPLAGRQNAAGAKPNPASRSTTSRFLANKT